MSPPDDRSPRVRAFSQMVSRPVEWLWPNWLPLGKLALFEGDPGLGKSLITLDLCARLSTGKPLPDGSPGPGPCNCLLFSAEDGGEDTIRPRLEAAGADMDRIFGFYRDGDDLTAPLCLPSQAGALDDILTQTRARLVVLDPITAFLDPGVQIASDPSVRRALFPLQRLAVKHRCVFELMRHLNKTGGGVALYRGMGSIAFTACCRCIWLVDEDPTDPTRSILAQVKASLAGRPPSLAYSLPPPGTPIPTVTWLGTSDLTADQLLAGPAKVPPPSPRQRASEFLAAVLEDGPLTSREIWAAAQEHDLAERTLQRVKDELGIRSVRVYLGKKQLSYWLLPGQELPDSVPPEARPPDLEPWLAPLREQFPPSTPLDDM
ncbi:MAG TPA: AAA family ATPase [Gemmataceae bacterium]|jgi:hypothetical protein|nr:AAA family ATPase [Gemmataceae bacterium]